MKDVGLTSDGSKEDIFLYFGVDIIIALGFEWGASWQNGVQCVELVGLYWIDVPVLESSKPLGTSAQDGDVEQNCLTLTIVHIHVHSL